MGWEKNLAWEMPMKPVEKPVERELTASEKMMKKYWEMPPHQINWDAIRKAMNAPAPIMPYGMADIKPPAKPVMNPYYSEPLPLP